MKVKLRMTEAHYVGLRKHLFPGDGLEAVALLLCGRAERIDATLIVHKLVFVPHDQCERMADRVTWPAAVLNDYLSEIWKKKLSIVKVHSHPLNYRQFSGTDDISDRGLAEGWSLLFDEDRLHGSLIMLPDGSMFGRSLRCGSIGDAFSSVAVIGHSIRFDGVQERELGEAHTRNLQTFGAGTMHRLARMRVAVIGCSGTGSIVIEQLLRLSIGELVLVDPESVDVKNLNRILNSTAADAKMELPKVGLGERLAKALDQGQVVEPLPFNLDSPEVVKAVASCDVIFGCVDSAEGRNLMNRLAAFYLLPYIDVGVGLVADEDHGIDTISGAIHYYFPGSTPLVERGVFTLEQVRAEELKRTNPEQYENLKKESYIQGVAEDRPAVIGINMFAGALAVHELLSRLDGFRNYHPMQSETVRFDLCEMALFKEGFRGYSPYLDRSLGRADVSPLLDRPSLSEVS